MNINQSFLSQQLLITIMINGNKPKNALQLPRISPLSDAYLLSIVQFNSNNKFTTLKPKRSDTHFKQNSAPKDLRNNTIYLEFPIGKKRPIIQYPSELHIDKLSQDAMFANRAICSMFRKDVRARMYKYNEQRANLMTERCLNNYVDSQNIGFRQFVEKELSKKERLSQIRKRKSPQTQRYVHNENITSWGNEEKETLEQQSYDSTLQQKVQKSIKKNKAKFPRIQ